MKLDPKIRGKIDKNDVPSYTGNVKTFDFNIGNLLDEKSLGRISSSLYVKGRGTELKDLTEKAKKLLRKFGYIE